MKAGERKISVKRVYEKAAATDGVRLLVERLWPRGMRKELLELDGWPHEVAPSTSLRRWFCHDPAKWDEFQRRYRSELDARPGAWRKMLQQAERGAVTLLFSSHDVERNSAIVLRDYLTAKIRGRRR